MYNIEYNNIIVVILKIRDVTKNSQCGSYGKAIPVLGEKQPSLSLKWLASRPSFTIYYYE